MDPFSVAVGLTLGALGVGLLASARRTHRAKDDHEQTRRQLRRLQREQARLDARVKKAEINAAYYQDRLEHAAADLHAAEAARDDYRRIAETHDLDTPGPAPTHVSVAVWAERQYSAHPADNLAQLARDLEPHQGRIIQLSLRLEALGGWRRVLRQPVRMSWKGPTERVLQDLHTFLADDDTRLMRGQGDKEWVDDDSPLRFVIGLDLLDVPAPDVLVRTVEVARVERTTTERIVEQPVLIEVPIYGVDEHDPKQVGLTREEVLALFEVELETKLGEFGMVAVGPVPSTPPAASDTPREVPSTSPLLGDDSDVPQVETHRGPRAIEVRKLPS